MSILTENFEFWAKKFNRDHSIKSAQDYCDETNLVTLQATIAASRPINSLYTLEAWAAVDARWAALEGNF
jgi:hypothetical protein